MTLEEMKPCPFCQSNRVSIELIEKNYNWQVCCYDCMTKGPEGYDKLNSIKFWNERK